MSLKRQIVLKISNIQADIPQNLTGEACETLSQSGAVRIERIISRGHSTPEGEWYDQDQDEWVMVVSGNAALQFEGESTLLHMSAGDYLIIPAHCRHRVAFTDPVLDTVWLAVHSSPLKQS